MLETLGSSEAVSQQQMLMRHLQQMRDPDQMSSKVIAKHDSDGDNLLSFEEIGFKEDHFAKADSDGDGLLSQEELSSDMQAHMQALANGSPRPPMGGDPKGGKNAEEITSEIFDELDTNEDGYVSLEESLAGEEMFNKADSDGDGLLSEEELATQISSKMEEFHNMMQGMGKGPRMPKEDEEDMNETDAFQTLLDALNNDEDDENEEEEESIYETLDILA